MRSAFIAALLALTAAPAFAQPGTAPWVYFKMDWCPTRSEVAHLRDHFDLSMSGCCVLFGKPRSPGQDSAAIVAPYSEHLANQYDGPTCKGVDAETRAAAAAALEALRRDIPQIVPRVLRGLSLDEFCVAFGIAARDRKVLSEHPPDDGVPAMAAAEAKRRRLQFNMPRVMSESLRIGDSKCQMLAAIGEPTSQNRTVNSAGTRVQHVYGSRALVYTTNDVVTAYQD